MSTYYYNFRSPIGSARITEEAERELVTMFDESGEQTGEVRFQANTGDAREFIYLLREEDPCVQHVGTGNGQTAYRQLQRFRGREVLSEYSETIAVETMRAEPNFQPLGGRARPSLLDPWTEMRGHTGLRPKEARMPDPESPELEELRAESTRILGELNDRFYHGMEGKNRLHRVGRYRAEDGRTLLIVETDNAGDMIRQGLARQLGEHGYGEVRVLPRDTLEPRW